MRTWLPESLLGTTLIRSVDWSALSSWVTTCPLSGGEKADQSSFVGIKMKQVRKVLQYVYVIDGIDRCKVGVSRNPKVRVNALFCMAGLPKTTRFWVSDGVPKPFGIKVERETHKTLAEFRLNGEWFNCPFDEAIDAVKSAMLQLDTLSDPVPESLCKDDMEARVDKFLYFLFGVKPRSTSVSYSDDLAESTPGLREAKVGAVEVPSAKFEPEYLSEADKFGIIGAVLEAVIAYGDGVDPEVLMEMLCDAHSQYLYHAWTDGARPCCCVDLT